MNRKTVFLISFCFLIFSGCNYDNFTVTTGISGKVEYGQGDCMPGAVQKEFNMYNGKIFFIIKAEWDKLGNGDYEKLKNRSINVSVKQGKLSVELPVEIYLVMPEELNLYSEENTITIKSGEVINKDFKFFKCTSY